MTTAQEIRLQSCAKVSRTMRDKGRAIFEHTSDSFAGGITYTLWLREQGAMMLTIASDRGADYYDVRERFAPPKKGERIRF